MKPSDYFLPYPKTVAVECRPDHQLAVEFDTGERGVFDMKPYLNKGVFKALRDEDASCAKSRPVSRMAYDDSA